MKHRTGNKNVRYADPSVTPLGDHNPLKPRGSTKSNRPYNPKRSLKAEIRRLERAAKRKKAAE